MTKSFLRTAALTSLLTLGTATAFADDNRWNDDREPHRGFEADRRDLVLRLREKLQAALDRVSAAETRAERADRRAHEAERRAGLEARRSAELEAQLAAAQHRIDALERVLAERGGDHRWGRR